MGAAAVIGAAATVTAAGISYASTQSAADKQAKAAKEAAGTQANAQTYAADLQAEAAKRAADQVQNQYDNTRADLAPYRATGEAGRTALMAALGLGPGPDPLVARGLSSGLVVPKLEGVPWLPVNDALPTIKPMGRPDALPQLQSAGWVSGPTDPAVIQGLTTPGVIGGLTSPGVITKFDPTQAGLEATPGYKFALSQGLQGVANANAAKGLGISGAALKGSATFAKGLADQTLQTNANIWNQNAGIDQHNVANLMDAQKANAGISQNNVLNLMNAQGKNADISQHNVSNLLDAQKARATVDLTNVGNQLDLGKFNINNAQQNIRNQYDFDNANIGVQKANIANIQAQQNANVGIEQYNYGNTMALQQANNNVYQQNIGNLYNPLASLTASGQNAAVTAGAQGTAATNTMNNLLLGGAQAQAGGITSAANATAGGLIGAANAQAAGDTAGMANLTKAFGSIPSTMQNYQMYQKLLGGGGGGGSAGGSSGLFGGFGSAQNGGLYGATDSSASGLFGSGGYYGGEAAPTSYYDPGQALGTY